MNNFLRDYFKTRNWRSSLETKGRSGESGATLYIRAKPRDSRAWKHNIPRGLLVRGITGPAESYNDRLIGRAANNRTDRSRERLRADPQPARPLVFRANEHRAERSGEHLIARAACRVFRNTRPVRRFYRQEARDREIGTKRRAA